MHNDYDQSRKIDWRVNPQPEVPFTAQPPKTELSAEEIARAVELYKARAEMVGKLTEFVGRFAPAIGEKSHADSHASTIDAEETPTDIQEARGVAILAAFEAITRIAQKA